MGDMTTPAYDPSRPCSKCGNPICASEFRRGEVSQYVVLQRYDRIIRHCGRCDYRWYELPLDHDAEAEEADMMRRREELEAA